MSDSVTPDSTDLWPWWVIAAVILGAALTATGALLALFATGEHLNTAGSNYADYFITRNLAVATLMLYALTRRARRILTGLMVLTALTQTLDALAAGATGRYGLIPIDLIYTAIFLIAASKLSHQVSEAR
ncbi:MAG: hypothetical protein ACRDX8_05945 [Acidimicrobiales bacterium]